MRRLATLWRLGRAFVRESHLGDDGASMQRVARFFASHDGAHAAPLTASVPVLRQLSRVLAEASSMLARHPALAEIAVRVALVEMDGFFQPYDAAEFRAVCRRALSIDLSDISAAARRAYRRYGGACHAATPRCARRAYRRSRSRARGDAFRRAAVGETRRLHAVQWIERACENVHAMIDLRQRAADQSYLRYRLREDNRLAVPEVLWDYCNDAVLTTRAIDTIALRDTHALALHGFDQAALIATLIEAFFDMALGVGLYHAGLDVARA